MNKFPIPYVLECMHFIAPSSTESSRIVRDYEFDFYVDGERNITIDGKHYHISQNCLVFRKPGQFTTSTGDYNMHLMTLDFSNKSGIFTEYFRNSSTPQQAKCEFDLIEKIPTIFYPQHTTELTELYKEIAKCSYPCIVDRELQKKYVTQFLLLVFYDACAEIHNPDKKHSKQSSLVKKICEYINSNFAQTILVEDIASRFFLNVNYLIRIFKKELGITPNQYILETRLRHARYMLVQTDLPIQEIAYSCGFNTPSYFSRCFQKRFGKNPYEYRISIEHHEDK